jgi:hypothetical protein
LFTATLPYADRGCITSTRSTVQATRFFKFRRLSGRSEAIPEDRDRGSA